MPMLSPKGRVIGDCTLTRLAEDRFLVMGGGAMQRIHLLTGYAGLGADRLRPILTLRAAALS